MEFVISGSNCSFAKRFKNSFFGPVAILSIGFILYCLFYGFSRLSLLTYFILLALSAMYAAFVTRKILHRVKFNMEARTVEVEVLRFNTVKVDGRVKFEDVQVTVRQNLFSRSTVWVLTIFNRNKEVYKQEEREGWSYEDFSRIEKFAKSIK